MNQLTPEQLEWCEKHLRRGKWKVNPRGLIDVEGSVILRNQDFQHLPVSFGRVSGGFDLEGCRQLLTLEGSPWEVGGYFDCQKCVSIKTLEGAPQRVYSWFSCDGCKGLLTLKGAPQSVGGNFHCGNCESLPEWVHSLVYDYNTNKIKLWKEFLELHDKFLQKPNLAQAKNLGLF